DAVSRILQHTSLSYKLFNQQFLIIYKNDEEGLKTLRRMSKYLDKLIRDEEKAITKGRDISPQLKGNYALKAFETIRGTVINDAGEPLIGVSILIKGKGIGAVTDLEGRFQLEGVVAQDVLVLSYIGYVSQEFQVGNNSDITVVLL